MEKTLTLTQDRGSCNDNVVRKVKISDSKLVYELNQFFGWKKDVTENRLFKQSTLQFDLFIKYLSEKGY